MKLSKSGKSVIFSLPIIIFLTFGVKTFAQEGNIVSYPDGSEIGITETEVREVEDVSVEEFTGRITRIENRTLSIESEEGVKLVIVPQSVRITRNGFTSSFEDLKVNDEVTVTSSNIGEVISIDSTESRVADISQLAIPGIIILFIVLLVGYLLLKRGSQDHIKTKTTQVS